MKIDIFLFGIDKSLSIGWYLLNESECNLKFNAKIISWKMFELFKSHLNALKGIVACEPVELEANLFSPWVVQFLVG